MKKAPNQTTLDKLVREKLTELQKQSKTDLSQLPLFDFLVQASPHLRRPEHLSSVVPYMEALEESPQFFALSAPPRHGKSVLVNHLVARQMLRHPGLRVAYGCYNLDLAGAFSIDIKSIFEGNNIEIDRRYNSKEEWRLTNGSVFKCVAPGSGFTGRGADLIIVDDPYKGRADAESGRIREATWNWFMAVAITRRSPQASVIVTHTRWNIEDLTGKLATEHHIPYINLPAINDQGEALWPDEWSLERLLDIKSKVGEYEWASLYQGEPRPRGGAVFGDTVPYECNDEGWPIDHEGKPIKMKRISIGIDCAYTKKTYSDWSVAVVLGTDIDDNHYVLEVVRKQCEAREFGKELKSLKARYPESKVYWYIGGIEKAVVEMFQNSFGIRINAVNAREDKFVRAQPAAAAWNAKKIRVPSTDTEWSRKFISEVLNFTGLDDPHDDQVDALAASFIPAAGKRVVRGYLNTRLLSF